jgi:quinol monooxygenase YgiN
MPEIVVVGSFKINADTEEEALEAFTALVEPTHAEEGCILYALHRGTDDPARLTFIERWESRELLDAHLQSDHVSALLERSDELWGENGEITVYDAVPAGDEKNGSLAGHAAAEGPRERGSRRVSRRRGPQDSASPRADRTS